MRERSAVYEEEFLAIFADCINLENNTARRYGADEYSLTNMTRLAALAGNPERQLQVVHVAGTKGKGSTCLYLDALVRSTSASCGVFTSPHLLSVRERFQINGRLIEYPQLLAAARAVRELARQAGQTATFFEFMTLLAVRLFAMANCRFAILETGIGGLLDSTNYVPQPVCTVITSVSRDHTELLGENIEEIASQKAGIIKPGVPVVVGPQPFPAAVAVLYKMAADKHAPVVAVTPPIAANSWLPPDAAPFLHENFATAMAVCNTLRISPLRAQFQAPRLPGRCEVLCHQPLVIIDVAHNADSARRLTEAVTQRYPDEDFLIVLGVVKGKDLAGILSELQGLGRDFILTNPRPPKASALNELFKLAGACSDLRFTVIPEIHDRNQLPPGRPLLFTGSFFTALIGAELFSS